MSHDMPTIPEAVARLPYSERTMFLNLARQREKPSEGWQRDYRLTASAVKVLFGGRDWRQCPVLDKGAESAVTVAVDVAVRPGEAVAVQSEAVGDLLRQLSEQAATIEAMQEFCGDMARYVGDWMDTQEREREALRARLERLEARPKPISTLQRLQDFAGRFSQRFSAMPPEPEYRPQVFEANRLKG